MQERTRTKPIIGSWYQRLDNLAEFRVVGIDTDENMVEIQNFDGNIDSMSFHEWRELALEEIEAPEDWTGPMDSLEEGDFGYDDDEFERQPRGPGGSETSE